ncbi:MAG: carboxy terminal-processing peptidase [Desulfuromonadaceae bacterium]|nr:carboxy terminal-processing peptidase [Desulfuromonadaceae bacterium]
MKKASSCHRSVRLLISVVIGFILLHAFCLSAQPLPENTELDTRRAKLLGFLVSQHLMRNHYTHKPLDDALSKAAFDLYIKQLDAQKRFLLASDVKMLGAYETYIDNEIRRGMIHLPTYSAQLMSERIPVVQATIEQLLAQPFDLTRPETLETDNKKLDFCKNDAEFRDRWRKILKYQVANTLLDLKEEAEKAATRDKDPVPRPDDQTLEKQAREKVGKRYTHLFARMSKDQEKDHFERYLNAIARAYDPHSNYLPPEEKEDFDIHMRGSLEGIGAMLREEDGFIKVVHLIPGGAAQRQGGLESEDVILKVAEGDDEPVDITDTRIRDAVELIRGPKGSTVLLHIKKPDGSQRVLSIVRDVVQIKETFVKSTLVTGPQNQRYGYLKIPAFYRDFSKDDRKGRNVTSDTRAELKKLSKQDIKGLIIDLRNNGGGSLMDAVDTTGLFIEEGPVVQIKDSNDKISVMQDEDDTIAYRGPIIVLVNKFSASASEILAGALQDYRRAVIVGSHHTHGKGTVQAVVDLDDNLPLRSMEAYTPLGALKVTVQKFYRVSGASTQYRGVEPDIVLPDRFEAIESGEKHLDYSLPWDTISGTDYQSWPSNSHQLEQLKQKSAQRIAHDAEFIHIGELANKAKERIDHSQRSLLMSDIQQDRQELKASEKEDKDLEKLMDGDNEEHWEERVRKDEYVMESCRVLDDMQQIPMVAHF